MRGWEEITHWKHDLNLLDIPFHGPRFTWSNKRSDSELIMEHLDRAYASPESLEEFLLTMLRNFPIIHSDHAPIWLHPTTPEGAKQRRPYHEN